jgi:hypothetical protein
VSSELTFGNFLKDFGMRIGAAAVVVGIFFGLGYIKRTDFLGLAGVLKSQLAFFTAAFLLITLVAVMWILYRQRQPF